METRDLFKKMEQKSSSKFETEWEQQQPNRVLYRTTYKTKFKSSVVEKEINVKRVQSSSPMSANRVQRNEADSDGTTNMQRRAEHPSLPRQPNENPAAMDGTSLPSTNRDEPESCTEEESVLRNSDDNQLPEDLQNSSDSCYLNGKPTASMGENGMFDNKLIGANLNFNYEKRSNLSSNENYSPQKLSNDLSLLKKYNKISTDTEINDLAGGDYAQSENDTFSVYASDIDKREISPPNEETFNLERSANYDQFQEESLNIGDEPLKDSHKNSSLGLQSQKFIDKGSNLSSSNSFICRETCGKNDWLTKTSNKNPERYNENYRRYEIDSDTDSSLLSNSLQSLQDSSSPSCLNYEFNVKHKELPGKVSGKHKNIASNNDFDLSRGSKNFSHPDSIDIISSVSSERSKESRSDKHSMNNMYSPMNNAPYELIHDTDISTSQDSDSHKNLEVIYFPDEPTTVKIKLKSDSSDESGSTGFDTQRSVIKLVVESSQLIQKDLSSATTQSDDNSSMGIYTNNGSTTSNTHHSDVDSNHWKTSVSSLVEYFEKLNSETIIGSKKVKSDSLVQIKSKYYETDWKNHNCLGPNKNKKKLNEEDSIKGKYSNCNKAGKDNENTFNTMQSLGNDFQSNSNNLLGHEETRKIENMFLADGHDKNEDLIDHAEYDLLCVRTPKETSPVLGDSKVDILHLSRSKSTIHLSQSQLLNSDTKHPKVSAEPKEADNILQANNEKLTNNILQREKKYPNFHYAEQEAHSGVQLGVSEATCSNSPDFPRSKSTIHLSERQLLNSDTKHSKESSELKAAGYISQANNEKLASDILQREKKYPNFHYAGEEAYSGVQLSVSEATCGNSPDFQNERCIFNKFRISGNTFKPSEGNSVEQKEFNDSRLTLEKILSYKEQNQGKSKPVGNVEESKEFQCILPPPSLMHKLCNSDSSFNNPYTMKLNSLLSPSRVTEVNRSTPEWSTVSNQSKQAMNLNLNQSDFSVENSLPKEPSDKAAKLHVLNPGLVKRNKVSNAHKTSYFSRRRVIGVISMGILFLFAMADWKYVLKYFEGLASI